MRCQRIKSARRTVNKHSCETQQIYACTTLWDLVDPNFSHPLPEACIPFWDLVKILFSHPLSVACILLRDRVNPEFSYPLPIDTCIPLQEEPWPLAIIQADISTAQRTQPKLPLLGAPGQGWNKATTGSPTTSMRITPRHAWMPATTLLQTISHHGKYKHHQLTLGCFAHLLGCLR